MIDLTDLILKLTAPLVHAFGSRIETVIHQTLAELCDYSKADRATLYLLTEDSLRLICRHEYHLPDNDALAVRDTVVPVDLLPQWLKQLQSSPAIQWIGVEQFDEHLKVELRVIKKDMCQSLIALPLYDDERLIGFWGFDFILRRRKWTDVEIRTLQALSRIFAAACLRQAGESLREQNEEMYRVLIENINEGVLISQNDRLIFVNPQLSRMLGYQPGELLYRNYREVFSPRGVQIILDRFERRQRGEKVPNCYEIYFACKDGKELVVEVDVNIISYHDAPATLAVVTDLSERLRQERRQQELEVQVIKQQRMASFGLMADGVAHNIKGPLTVIVGRTQMLRASQPELREAEIILTQCKKIEAMVDTLMKKSQRWKETRAIQLDLNELLRTELSFLEADQFFRFQVEKKYTLKRNLPTVEGSYVDFAQALLTLIQFSVASLEDSATKQLRIKTESDADFIEIEISDSGCGIPPEEMPFVFMPTTRRIKPGIRPHDPLVQAYINLASAAVLLAPYGAKLNVASQPNRGTTFSVKIPLRRR